MGIKSVKTKEETGLIVFWGKGMVVGKGMYRQLGENARIQIILFSSWQEREEALSQARAHKYSFHFILPVEESRNDFLDFLSTLEILAAPRPQESENTPSVFHLFMKMIGDL